MPTKDIRVLIEDYSVNEQNPHFRVHTTHAELTSTLSSALREVEGVSFSHPPHGRYSSSFGLGLGKAFRIEDIMPGVFAQIGRSVAEHWVKKGMNNSPEIEFRGRNNPEWLVAATNAFWREFNAALPRRKICRRLLGFIFW